MTFIVCKKKGRECRKPIVVCEICKKRAKCKDWNEFKQRALPGTINLNKGGVSNGKRGAHF